MSAARRRPSDRPTGPPNQLRLVTAAAAPAAHSEGRNAKTAVSVALHWPKFDSHKSIIVLLQIPCSHIQDYLVDGLFLYPLLPTLAATPPGALEYAFASCFRFELSLRTVKSLHSFVKSRAEAVTALQWEYLRA